LILEKIGLKIPMLPATRCLATDDAEARKLLFIKESRSSWIDAKVVPDYTREVGLSFEIASGVIDIPEFKWGDIAGEYEEEREKKEKADIIPEVEDARIESGDLIELGRHRVLCGDSTRAEDVERLMEGKKADMVFTDPPYGIKEAAGKNKSRSNLAKARDYGNKNWDDKIPPKIAFDLIFKWSENQMFFGGNFFVEYLKNSPCWLVWDKDNGKNDFADCELVWTSLKSAARVYKWRWNGMLQENMQNKEKRFHPTQKPVGLFGAIFNDYLFQTCLDPFLGSGSTLIACEKTGRRCFGIEIDPHYCSVTVQRWVDFTGNDVVRINGREVLWSEYKK